MKRKHTDTTPKPVDLCRLITRMRELGHEAAATRVVVSHAISDITPPDAAIRGVPSLLMNLQAGLRQLANEVEECGVK